MSKVAQSTEKQNRIMHEQNMREIQVLFGINGKKGKKGEKGKKPSKDDVLRTFDKFLEVNVAFDPSKKLLEYVSSLWSAKEGPLTLLDLLLGDYTQLFHEFFENGLLVVDDLMGDMIGSLICLRNSDDGSCLVASEIFRFAVDNQLGTLTPADVYECLDAISFNGITRSFEEEMFVRLLFRHVPKEKYIQYLDSLDEDE